MIFKHDDGTVVEMTAAEFVELGNVFCDVSMDPEKVAEVSVEGMTEATTEFKAGDKVEVVGVTYVGESKHRGAVGKVKKVWSDGDVTVHISGGGGAIYPPSSLKLIEEEPEEVLSYENVKEGELFEVTDDGSNKFPTGTIVCSINSIQNDSLSSRFQDVVSGKTDFLKYNEIKRHTPEVLSEDNVKEGEYFVITDNNNGHNFTNGEIVKAISYTDYRTFTAEYLDGSDWYYTCYTDVRRATAEEITEATKPKEVKFEIGDIVNVGGRFAKVTSEIDEDGDCRIKYYVNGVLRYKQAANFRHATDEEKSHLQTLIGREKDEYKSGDLVELVTDLAAYNHGYGHLKGYVFEVDELDESSMPIHLKDNGNKADNFVDTWSLAADLKLITPVEWRHDFVGGA